MNTQKKAIAAPKPTFTPLQTRLLQRTCTCGGSAGIDGYCNECRDRKFTSSYGAGVGLELSQHYTSLEQQETHSTEHATIPGSVSNSPFSGHNFSQLQVHAAVPETIQTKLKVNQPGDQYEREADQVAEQVMRMSETESVQREDYSSVPRGIRIQRMSPQDEEVRRQPEEGEGEEKLSSEPMEEEAEEGPGSESIEEEKEETLQAKASPGHTPTVTPELHSRINSLRGGGQPLDAATRAYMEPRFGFDFSQVRIHTDERAAETARAVNALAYTVGSDVVFGAGQYTPQTSEGRSLLAHELTHVVQQDRGVRDSNSNPWHPEDVFERVAENASRDVTNGKKHISIQTQTQPSLIQARISEKVVAKVESYSEIINRVAKEEGIHPNWVRSVIATESGGERFAKSPTGYTGLMQAGKGEEKFDPETSIRAGITLLKQFQTSLGKFLKKHNLDIKTLDNETVIGLVMVAYNAGPGTLKKAMEYSIASGDIKRWMDPENFQRALVYYGAYNAKSSLSSGLRNFSNEMLATELRDLTGMSEELIRSRYFASKGWNKQKLRQAITDHVENERRQLKKQDLSMAQIRTRASRWLLNSVEFKHNNIRTWYVDRVLEYMRYYNRPPVKYIKFEEPEIIEGSPPKTIVEPPG